MSATKFTIIHNPYSTSRLKFKKNGMPLSSDSKIASNISNTTFLQYVLMPYDNWKGLIKEILYECKEECSVDNSLDIEFIGRECDWLDFYESLSQYNEEALNSCLSISKIKITPYFIKRESDNSIQKSIDDKITELKEASLDTFPELLQKDSNGQNIFELYSKMKNEPFNITIAGTISSGKSTFINALLGDSYLPYCALAKTAKVTRIYPTNEDIYCKIIYVDGDPEVITFENREYVIQKLNEANESELVDHVEIYGNVFKNMNLDSLKNNFNICFNDTPGPNNAVDDSHKEVTYDFISHNDSIILFVTCPEKIRESDTADFIKEICSYASKDGKVSEDRFIFVLNKCDGDVVEDENSSLDSVLDYTKQTIERYNIKKPVIVPVTSKMALLLRKSEKQKLEKRSLELWQDCCEDIEYYDKFHLERFGKNIPSTVKDKVENELNNQCDFDSRRQLEIHTGIRTVEKLIEEYIEKYSLPIRINSQIKPIENRLLSLEESMITAFEAYQKGYSSEDLAKKNSVLKKAIDEFDDKFEAFVEDFKSKKDTFFDRATVNRKFDEEVDKIINNNKNVSKDYIRKVLLNSFQKIVDLLEETFDDSVSSIENAKKSLVNSFNKSITNISGELKSRVNLSKLVDSFQMSSLDLNRMISNVDTDKYVKTISRTKNPNYHGVRTFFGNIFRSLFGREEIQKYIEVTDFDCATFVAHVANNFRIKLSKNIQNFNAYIDSLMSNYTQGFSDSIKQLKEEISIMENNTNNLIEEVKQNEELQQYRLTKIREFLDFLNGIRGDKPRA